MTYLHKNIFKFDNTLSNHFRKIIHAVCKINIMNKRALKMSISYEYLGRTFLTSFFSKENYEYGLNSNISN